MSTAALPGLLTFEEFERLPDPDFGKLELREGIVVTMPPPRTGHALIENKLLRLLFARISDRWFGMTSFGCRIGVRSYLIPDIGITTAERMEQAPEDGYFLGSPEFVVEVLSPSNSAEQIELKRALYFSHGCQEFWVVNPLRRGVTVHRFGPECQFYSGDESIPLGFFDSSELPVRAIFENKVR